jgi:hypothetical protein
MILISLLDNREIDVVYLKNEFAKLFSGSFVNGSFISLEKSLIDF